jgi:hypothetical protein
MRFGLQYLTVSKYEKRLVRLFRRHWEQAGQLASPKIIFDSGTVTVGVLTFRLHQLAGTSHAGRLWTLSRLGTKSTHTMYSQLWSVRGIAVETLEDWVSPLA